MLGLGANNLTGRIPPSFGNLSSIRNLSLAVNKLVGNIPYRVGHLKSLVHFSISANKISVPTNLGNLPDLRLLDLSNNYLGRSLDFLKSLTNCSKLDILGLSRNQFGGVLPIPVGNLSTQLTELYFGSNEISGTIPVTLGNLVNLIGLGLEHNLFTGLIPTTLKKFQKIQALYLGGNRLLGELPTSIGNLTLFLLNLHENRLEGSIPPSLAYWSIFPDGDQGIASKDLVQVPIGPVTRARAKKFKNVIPFEGSLPSSMAFLKGLQFLDVSRNNLSGSIPKGLEKLPSLKELNLSFNDIKGELPLEGVLKNASAISVIGNTKLCGGVPQLLLPPCPVEVIKPTKSLSFKLKIAIIVVVVCLFLFSFILFLHRRKKSKRNSSSLGSTIDLLPNVSYKMLYQATNGFSPSNLVGTGSFGCI
ncbi:putative receptor-like protein kinase At3g47110 [Quercus robur]|uniref:putative receptor-like protein kinase At3g47110 n=1 Tax=Quercus robur TaxID=38942 RepID=UPI0021628136|nr:putative receptor-like protein kinase At3g47110 [Quercus robur]